ncbi:MAG: hypothetical protein RIG62_27570 [Cyclobacteriaceae bacterium]
MKKVYSAIGVRLGTFIGGPLAGGYLLSQNFKAIGRADLARRTQVLGMLITVAFLSALAAAPEGATDKIPGVIFPLLFMFLANRLFDRYQKEAVDQLLQAEEGTQLSNWRVVGISLLLVTITLLLLLFLILLLNPTL